MCRQQLYEKYSHLTKTWSTRRFVEPADQVQPCARRHRAPAPCGESKHTLFVSIICLWITWGPVNRLASGATETGSRGRGQNSAPRPGCHKEEPVSLTRSACYGNIWPPGSGDSISAFPPVRFAALKRFQLVYGCSETQTASFAAEGPTRGDPADRDSVGRSGEICRAGVTSENQDVTRKRDRKRAGCPANVRKGLKSNSQWKK